MGPDTSAGSSAERATFLVADLAGYTALTEAHGDEHAAETAGAFFAAVRAVAGDYGAEEVKTMGDAVLLRVPDAAEALHLAARVVGDYAPRHRFLGVRVGVHTGPAVRRDGDWFGAGVNIACRVGARAEAGEVLLSATTRSAAGDAFLPGQLRSRGAHVFKNVRQPVELYALVPGRAGAALPIDPVCRMAVDPALAADRGLEAGVEYFFCSAGCARAFRLAPDRYTGED